MFILFLTANKHSVNIYSRTKVRERGHIDMKTKRRNVTIKSRFRFSVFVALVLFLSVSFINTAIGLNTAEGSTPDKFIEVQVSAGDTLWNLSETYMDNVDVREGIYMICETNDISASDLRSGMTLSIPVVDC